MDDCTDSTTVGSFPTSNLTPKCETGVTKWIRENPQHDGRGIIIAILDSGIDPGAPGLRATTEGKVKLIESYDCSGAGDVDTSVRVKSFEKDDHKYIKGLTGRDLKIPPSWVTESEEYHVGFKPLFDLYPDTVCKSSDDKNKDKYWTPDLNKARNTIEKQVEEFNATKFTDKKYKELLKQDFILRLKILKDLDENYLDDGPVFDCVLFRKNNDWTVCLSCDENGDLSNGIVLKEYSKFHEFAPLTPDCSYNVTVNVWDDGNLLEIVGISNPHGTHVASIAAGNFPENPKLNGIAPGAQIISLMIGDLRIDSMESGTSLCRALLRISTNYKNPESKVDIINMSYGEGSCFPPSGSLARMMSDVVNKFGVTFVVAGGNDGPGLQTVTTPPLIVDDVLIGVCAYVSPTMRIAVHSMIKNLEKEQPSEPYGFSSRGPCIDGRLGISLSAPGAAIASIPNYIGGTEMMTGTSMSAPHIAACFALVMGACKSQKIQVTPYSIRKAFENTAVNIKNVEPFAQGYGIVKVQPAYNLCVELSTRINRFVRYKIRILGGRTDIEMLGIYIRDPPIYKAKEFRVNITPYFLEFDQLVNNQMKVSFRMHLLLTCTADWVKAPQYLEISNEEKGFSVVVDPSNKLPGVYFTRIDAINSADQSIGPLFSIPVTLIVPVEIDRKSDLCHLMNIRGENYPPGKIERFFLNVPSCASWGILSLRNESSRIVQNPKGSLDARFVVQRVTMGPGEKAQDGQSLDFIKLHDMEKQSIPFSLLGGKVLELVICREFDDSGEDVYVEGTLEIHGGTLDSPSITGSIIEGHSKVIVTSRIGREEIEPKAKISHQVVLLNPKSMEILPLSRTSRDKTPNESYLHALNATYEVKIEHPSSVLFTCPLFSTTIYESEYLSHFVMVFDEKKKYMHSADLSNENAESEVMLDEGTYTVKAFITHDKIEVLSKLLGENEEAQLDLKNPKSKEKRKKHPKLLIMAKMSLAKDIPLPIFTTFGKIQGLDDAKINPKSLHIVLNKGQDQLLFISYNHKEWKLDTLPSANLTTVYMEGSFTFLKDLGKLTSVTPIKLYCHFKTPPKNPQKSIKFEELVEDQISIKTSDEQSINKSDLKSIVKIGSDSEPTTNTAGSTRGEVYKNLKISFTEFRKMKNLNLRDQDLNGIRDKGNEILDQANVLTKLLDKNTTKKAKEVEVESDDEEPDDPNEKKEQIIFVLVVKGSMLIHFESQEFGKIDSLREGIIELCPEDDTEVFIKNSCRIEVIDFMIEYSRYRKLFGRALRLLLDKKDKKLGDPWSPELWDSRILQVFSDLKWNHCIWLWKRNSLVGNPPTFRPF